MKITIDNYKKIIPQKDQLLMHGLLLDLEELNQELEDLQEPYRKLYIDYITEHTEYSPERTDPCPDYYGMYKLVFENKTLTHFNKLKFAIFFIFLKLSNNLFLSIFISAKDEELSLALQEHLAFLIV